MKNKNLKKVLATVLCLAMVSQPLTMTAFLADDSGSNAQISGGDGGTVLPTPTPASTTEATPTPTPTAEVTPTPTPTAEVTPTPTPTAEVTPTPTPTAEVTPTPTPTAEVTPTPTPTTEAIPSIAPEVGNASALIAPMSLDAPMPANVETVSVTLDFENETDIVLDLEVGKTYTVSSDPNYNDSADPNDYIIPQSDGALNAWHVEGTWLNGNLFSVGKGVVIPTWDVVLTTIKPYTGTEITDISTVTDTYKQVASGSGSKADPYILEKGYNYQIFTTDKVAETIVANTEIWRTHIDSGATSYIANDIAPNNFEGVDYETTRGYINEDASVQNQKYSIIVSADEVGEDNLALSYFTPESEYMRRDHDVVVKVVTPLEGVTTSEELDSLDIGKTYDLIKYLNFDPISSEIIDTEWSIEKPDPTSDVVLSKQLGELYTGTSPSTTTIKVIITTYISDNTQTVPVPKIDTHEFIFDVTTVASTAKTVTFDVKDGYFNSPDDATAQTGIGDTISSVPTPVAPDGMIFAGWFLDEGATVRFTEETIVTKDSKVYASFVSDADHSIITFDTNVPASEEAEIQPPFVVIENGKEFEGAATKVVPTPVLKSGNKNYIFAGWYTSNDSGNTLSSEKLTAESVITSDVTYYAKWENISSKNDYWSHLIGKVGYEVVTKNPQAVLHPIVPGVSPTVSEVITSSVPTTTTTQIQNFEFDIFGEQTEMGSDIIIVLDKSYSMNELSSRWSSSVLAIQELAEQLYSADNNRIAMVQFAGNTYNSFNFKNNLADFNTYFETREPGHYLDWPNELRKDSGDGSNFTLALRQALEFIDSRTGTDRQRPVHLVFLSDGNPEISHGYTNEEIPLEDGSLLDIERYWGHVSEPLEGTTADPRIAQYYGLTGENEAKLLHDLGVRCYVVPIELPTDEFQLAINNTEDDEDVKAVDPTYLDDKLKEIGNDIIYYNETAHATYELPSGLSRFTLMNDVGTEYVPYWSLKGSSEKSTDFSKIGSGSTFSINGDTITFDLTALPQGGITLGFYAEYTPTSGGGGGDPDPQPDPTPEPSPEPTPDPEQDITDEETPLGDLETPPEEDLLDEDTPLGTLPDGDLEIVDPEIPLGDLPQTGAVLEKDSSAGIMALISGSVMVAWYAISSKRKDEDNV